MKKLILLALVAVVTGCAGIAPGDSQAELVYKTYVKAGQVMPVTRFTDIQGRELDLQQSDKRKLILLFATWCPDSQNTIRRLQASELSRDPDIQIIGIGREESRDSLEKFAVEYQAQFPLVADTDRAIYRQFANAGIPRLILLDKDNRIVQTEIGEGERPLENLSWN